MNCKKVNELMIDYVDDNLSIDFKNEVNKHLDSCKRCRLIHQEVSKSLEFLNPSATIPEQPFYYTQLKQRMENELESRTPIMERISSKKVIQPIAYLASIIIAVYIGILIGSSSNGNYKYSDLESNTNTPLETFAEYNYLNDLKIETIEDIIIEDKE